MTLIDERPPRRRWGTRHGLRPSVPKSEWRLPGGTVTGPAFDYGLGQFTGQLADGTGWTAPWSRELLPHITSLVNGWCTQKQGFQLHDLAAAHSSPDTRIVEVGTARGLSAVWLGWAARQTGSSVLCVDLFDGPPYDGHEEWANGQVAADWIGNISYAGLTGTCTPLKSDSAAAGHGYTGPPVSLLYIDGLHTYKGCRGDFEAWRPHLAPGAIVAFDDCDPVYPGILRFQRELDAGDDVQLLGRADFMLWWRAR